METFADVISLWPSLSDLATEIGVPYGVVKQWRRRNSIPANKWQAIISAAQARGHLKVTADFLAIIASGADTQGEAA